MDQQFSYLKIIVNQNKNLLFSGCGGNKNRFYSYEECSQKCIQQISPKRPGKYSLAHKKTRQLHNDGMWDHLKKERLINQSPRWKLYFNPTRRGAFKAHPEQKWQFKHLLVIPLSQKNLTFPRSLWGCISYPFGYWKQHFCCQQWQFPDHKIRFLAFFEAKMTKIDILNLKLIIPD